MSTANGVHANGDPEALQGIYNTLRLSYDPHTSNELRQSALQYLDDVKKQVDAPQHGFTLASDETQQAFARHFGLSLLDSAIRYRWDDHSEEQANTLRKWITSLAQNITPHDPAYFRNKVAYLWAEVAKREWAGPWMDMDQLLVALWESPDVERSSVYKVLVLSILETLSEDICNREDPIAGLRQDVLGQAFNEIIIPERLFQSHLESRGNNQKVRYTSDGWLARMCSFLASLSQSNAQNGRASEDPKQLLMKKTLEALKPTVVWISFEAVLETMCMDRLFQSLASGNAVVQTVSSSGRILPFLLGANESQVSVEVMYAIVSRQYNGHFHSQWSQIFRSLLDRPVLELIKSAYTSAQTSADDIDDEKYTLQKKISEVLTVLA